MGSFSSETCDQYPEPEIHEFETESMEDHSNNNNPPNGLLKNKAKKKKKQVFLEGYVEASDEDNLTRTKSLTDEDLDELKGCLDLGFGFSYEEIPELCNTLPALELCYSMNQRFLDDQQKLPEAAAETCSSGSGPIANWKISSPGDHPEDVKARLKFWAQAVACTVKLCS
ncbi:Pectinesterase [Actinidia chinensis var. chinensis]|uniref:Pectinesterase n=1 Tax=Actinidia chinensis var. chinensis TaxID=1590841 RepID=A0A2R6R957_ACTCC|nr:Pectinesterase [Actinidia chinensis var. chinensis]